MNKQTMIERIAALKFYDIANMARKAKGATLGVDINRAFRDTSKGPSKIQFAQYVVGTIDNAKIQWELDNGPWEKSSRDYYAQRGNASDAAEAAGDAGEMRQAATMQQASGQTGTPAEQAAGQASADNVRESLDDADKAGRASGKGTPPEGQKPPALEDRVTVLEQRADGTDERFNVVADAFGQVAGAVNLTRGMVQELDDKVTGDIVKIHERIDAMDKGRSLFVTVNNEGRVQTTDMGRQHKCFDKLLKLVSAGINVWMTGPAGSGKTTAAQNVAKALGLKFYFTGAVRDEFNLLGFTDAQGRTVRKPFREAWEHGGVFLWDEIDGSDPSALVAFNAALANGVCDFPDGMIPKHRDCVIIAAANTWGNSATSEYIGRNKQDAASLDRFAMLAWPYDEELELDTCGNPKWAKRVQTVRAKVAAQGIKQVISPRSSYMGAQLLASGMPENDVVEMLLKRGMTDAQWANVKA